MPRDPTHILRDPGAGSKVVKRRNELLNVGSFNRRVHQISNLTYLPFAIAVVLDVKTCPR